MYILGLNSYHGDSSACLIRDGRIVAAAEEERFRRVKHWAGFPSQAIAYCLAEAGIAPADVAHVAVNSDPRANTARRLWHVLAARPQPLLLLDRLRNRRRRASVESELAALPGAAFRGQVHAVEHHLAHLASCFLVSPFEHAAVVSVDGFGDFASAAWGTGAGGAIAVDGRVYFPHSLGVFYQAVTQYLGFPHYGDEYKVMGLAPYGRPSALEAMRRIVQLYGDGSYALDLRYFRHHREHVPYQWSDGAPHVGDLFSPALEELLGPRRRPDEPLADSHRDIARSAQAMYEEAFFHLLRAIHKRHPVDNLALAGGCAMNSVGNGKVYANTPFKRMYVQAAAGDAGGAIGAAFVVSTKTGAAEGASAPGRFHMDHAYWGPGYSNEDIGALLSARATEVGGEHCTAEKLASDEALLRRTAQAIADGRVVGWFQGRMEWGPRALGNRSILCDPRRGDMKAILNEKIKRRESFRPFAPSVLRKAVADWFDVDDDVPFMMQVYSIRRERQAAIPAVTHVDGTGRLQTVDSNTNSRYYRLIEAFDALTGVPMVLNTSFNENEPVVCTPEEALDCFLRTKMDVLVMEDWFVERRGG